jgi:hypothetical protein
MGHHAPPPRPTRAAALLLALVLSAPFALLAILEVVIRALF